MNNILDFKGRHFINNVVLCNLLDREFFRNIYEKSEILKEYENEGKRIVPSFQYLIEDLFYLLYKVALTLKEDEEVSIEVRPHLIFLKQLMNTNKTIVLRRRTKGNIINTYHTLNFYILWILKLLEDEKTSKLFQERNKLLNEITETQGKLFKEEQRKNQRKENVLDEKSNNDEDKNAEHQSEGQEIQGSPGEVEGEENEEAEAEKYAQGSETESNEFIPTGEDPVAQNLDGPEVSKPRDFDETMDEDIEFISRKIEELERKLETLKDQDDVLLEEFENTLEEIRFEDIAEEAVFLLEELEQKVSTIGTSSKEMKSLPFDFIIKLSEIFKDSKVDQLINRIGRTKKLARKGQRNRKKKFKGIQSRKTLSDDINNITEDEYLALGLGIEALELDFYDRYLNAQLSTWEGSRVEKKRKGPIIVCYDGSASMEGDRILEAKAHLFAFMDIAKNQKRRLLAIQFSSQKEDLLVSELEPFHENMREVVDIIEGFIGRGTDFEKPLLKSLEFIRYDGYKDADIIFMTDGESQISPAFKNKFKIYKEKYKFKMIGILINFTRKEYSDIQELCDEVYYVSEGQWNTAISEKLFSI